MVFNKGYSIQIAEKRCLNQRHKSVACNHCKSHCPADAIILDENRVYLNKDKCNGCGLCFSDCPTQVFRSGQWDETAIIGNIKEAGWEITEFFCGNHSSPYLGHQDRNRGALHLPACLSIVTRGAWYELGLKTQIELHLDQCEGCPMAKTIPRLELNIATAAEWLTASGCAPKFSDIRQSSKGPIKKSMKAIDTGLKVTSRRDLFLSLIHRGRQVTDPIFNSKTSSPPASDPVRQSSYLPDWRQRLSEVYSQNAIEGSPPAYWPTIKMNDKCVHCGMCTLFCPSGALQSVVKDGICTYDFSSGLCLDCRICELVCEQEAILRDKEVVEKPFARTAICALPAADCRRCGSVTADHSTHLCYWCSRKAAIDDEFNDACRKMFIESR